MTASTLKQLLVVGILFATFSLSVSFLEEAEIDPENIQRLLQHKARDPRAFNYIKTPEGRRQPRQNEINVVTTTTPEGETRKLQTGELRCQLWQTCFLFQDDQGDSHRWECVFDDPRVVDRFGGYESKQVVVEGVPDVNHFLEINGADSGHSVLVMSQAEIQTDRIVVDWSDVVGVEAYVPDDGRVDGEEPPLRGAKPPRTDRRLASPTGDLNTLVVRVNALDNSPTANAAQISSDVFGDEYCLKTQYAKCSYNQLRIQEYIPGNGISNIPTEANAPGVVDIYVNVNAEGATTEALQAAANAELQQRFGVSNPGTLFDLVLFCMPPGMGNWLAYAYIGRWDSYYNNDWCQAMSSQMHEVGHSIGLHHSGEYEGSDPTKEYGDQTDMMGFSYRSDDTPEMCFNPAKNWQLGWYEPKTVELNPNNDLSMDPTTFVVNGVVNYNDNTPGSYIVIKIGDFYIGFNRATSFNVGVIEAPNQVVVNEKMGGPSSSTKSKLAAKIGVGGSFNIEISTLLSVNVKYVESQNNGKDAVIELTIVGEPIECQGEYDAEIVVDIATDRYPTETEWGITDPTGVFLFYKDDYTTQGQQGSVTIGGLCRGLEYTFVIMDGYGDGICCTWGNGGFAGRYGDLELFSGGTFTDRLTIPFTLPLPEPPVTLPPSSSPSTQPTTAPSSSPSNVPTETPPVLTGCVDQPNFLYRNTPGKDCSWVKMDTARKTKIVCRRRAFKDTRFPKVWEFCKKTCSDAGVNKACPATSSS